MIRFRSGRAAAVALALTAAVPAAGATRAAKPANAFCTAAKPVAANIVGLSAIGSEGESASQLKAFYAKITAAEPALLRTAPAAAKGDLKPVFAYVKVVVTDFQEAGWDPDMLAPVLPDLNARAAKIKGQLKALKSYFDGTCKLHV
jgi:hypothetical protein